MIGPPGAQSDRDGASSRRPDRTAPRSMRGPAGIERGSAFTMDAAMLAGNRRTGVEPNRELERDQGGIVKGRGSDQKARRRNGAAASIAPPRRRASTAMPGHPAMYFRRVRLRLALAAAALLASGCPPKPSEGPPPPPPRDVDDIIATVNAQRIAADEPLYAPYITVSLSLRDDKGRRHDLDLRGSMVVRRPRSLWMRLDHALEEGQVELGSNEAEYWLSIRRDYATMWWGRHEHVGKPEVEPLPIDPARIADTLGLRMLPARGALGPFRRCFERYDELTYGRNDPIDGFFADRVYAVDRYPPFLIRRIDFLDRAGQAEMVVWLDDYCETDGHGLFPRKLRLHWPKRDSSMTLGIDRLRAGAKVNPRVFVRPRTPPEGIRRIVQVDAACEAAASPGASGE